MIFKTIGLLVVVFVLVCPLGILGQEQLVETDGDTTSAADITSDKPLLPAVEAAEPAKDADTAGAVVNYTINAELLHESRKLKCSEILTWRNTTGSAVDNLRFHLYYNAFRSPDSTLMRERNFHEKSQSHLNGLKFGEVRIEEMQIAGGEFLTPKMVFISPDDANKDDRTVMEVKLEKPVGPEESVTLKINFTLTIPQIFKRTGKAGDYYFFSQWFPKIGVLQADGLWNCHQFHNNSEFFSDFGTYTVNITLPERFIVGATGNLVKSDKNVDGTVTLSYKEQNIHDFAWVAYPGFKRITETIKSKGKPGGTIVELLLAPGHESARENYLRCIEFSLNYLEEHIFPYPYRKITVVDPPFEGIASGFMEYPTLITTYYSNLVPSFINLSENTLIHEIAHQYFYGIVGSDEAREAWLDEGIATFFELEIADAYYKDANSFLDFYLFQIDCWEMSRWQYASLLPVDKVNQYAWEFLESSQYGHNVYDKAAIFLRSLKNLVGKEKMYNFFKFYTTKFKYKHPGTQDFIDTFNAFMNEDFTWAFDMYINGETKLDHAVYLVKSDKISSKPDTFRNEAVFLRKEGYFPVELMIKLKNQKEIKAFWKDKKKWKKIVFTDTSPIDSVAIDPELKIPLDTNYLNNSRVLKPGKTFIKRLSLKFGFFFQNLMGFLIF